MIQSELFAPNASLLPVHEVHQLVVVEITGVSVRECKRRWQLCKAKKKVTNAPGNLSTVSHVVVEEKCVRIVCGAKHCRKNKAAIYLPVSPRYVLEKSWIQFTIADAERPEQEPWI